VSARALVLALACCALAAGCTKGLQGTLLPNERPVIELTHAPAVPTGRYDYAYEFKWFGHDPDGRVDYFIYAVDPPTAAGSDTAWTSTRLFSITLQFTASERDSTQPSRSVSFHTFVIKAVDNRGEVSVPEVRSFFASTIAPFVHIINPSPTALATVRVAPTTRITWVGSDLDGVATKEPVKYKWILLTASSEFPVAQALLDPDSLRRYYAPDFAGWDSTDADTRSVQLTGLAPGATYVFAVIAYDEAGAYSPQFSLDSNMLRFRADFATTLGPKITLSNNTFTFTYPSGGYSLDASREVAYELLPGKSTFLQWSAEAGPGSTLRSYRWRLDGDVSDETPRTDDNDVTHWSTPSALTTRADLGPFGSGEVHRFYLEVEDDNGNRSLGIVRISVLNFSTSFARDLLIVDDTRLYPDQTAVGGCVRPPIGTWPTAAELDTFLYARGNVPWRCYPAGTITPRGLFGAYEFDTAGTTTGVFPFGTLARYKNVVWIVDARSALNGGSIFGSNDAITSLRRMTDRTSINTLAAYVEGGGRLWLLGGGAAYASSIAWGRVSTSGGTTFNGVPGMFMYEFSGWRSQFRQSTVFNPVISKSSHVRTGDPNAPSYTNLPPSIALKTSATDPFPPNRTGQSPSLVYRTVLDIEFLLSANHVLETDPDDPTMQVAVLDTLYKAIGIGLPAQTQTSENVLMTYYRGGNNAPVLFSGFSIWDYRRSDEQALVDFVLQDVWGLTPRPDALPRPGP